jgi:hypothetical protein
VALVLDPVDLAAIFFSAIVMKGAVAHVEKTGEREVLMQTTMIHNQSF